MIRPILQRGDASQETHRAHAVRAKSTSTATVSTIEKLVSPAAGREHSETLQHPAPGNHVNDGVTAACESWG
ncbi:protein of unknown function [Candidatus Filomicrobium marinum]|uniref:Uncharacterized protein n=1 Tax=Candidatus Filomicrobium marinum TaxID=1608628 RepID=A0A0D6JCC9_9HYPH|nr:protein of unknown function [Candidatus Filomicrobium marinum]CPR16422.1 protein of unknown function [Candidatus Filomicrobium marinum]